MAKVDDIDNLSLSLPASSRFFHRGRHTVVMPAVQLAHSGLIAALGQTTPHDIVGFAADRFDIMERRDHIHTVLAAVIAYTKAIVADTKKMAPVGYVSDETGYLEDAASSVYATLDRAVETMIGDVAEAAE
jgi:hypothetical protein